MSKIEMLRLLITQRLTAAAEEIFGVFGRTIAEYEEEISRSKLEIDRQRRLLELRRTPRISVPGDGSALPEQQDWTGLDLDEGASPHIKEEEDDWSERDETPQMSEQNNLSIMTFRSNGGSEFGGRRDRGDRTSLLPKFPGLEDLDDLELDPQPELPVLQTRSEDEASDPSLGNGQLNHGEPEAPPPEVVDSYICTICGRAFAQRSHWAKHVQVHRKVDTKTDKSYTCDICGKRLTRFDGYQKHLRIHTGEKPYCCGECGRRFSDNSNYKRHTRTHAAQKTAPT